MNIRPSATKPVISYNKLWKLLIDRNMKRIDLIEITGISSSTLAKLGKSAQVSLDTLVRISCALHCEIGDVVDLTRQEHSHY